MKTSQKRRIASLKLGMVCSFIIALTCMGGMLLYSMTPKVKPNTIGESANLNSPSRCSGKYYGQMQGTSLKYTFILNTDGTFEADYSGNYRTSGTYIIENEKITFIYPIAVASLSQFNTSADNYFISKDCSYITMPYNTTSFNLYKQ